MRHFDVPPLRVSSFDQVNSYRGHNSVCGAGSEESRHISAVLMNSPLPPTFEEVETYASYAIRIIAGESSIKLEVFDGV